MSHEELLNNLERRIPFNVMRSILKNKDMPTHHGWRNTKNIYKEECESNPLFLSKVLALQNEYKQHLLTGEKVISIYKIENEIIDDFTTFFDDFIVDDYIDPKSLYVKNYPFPVNDLSNIDDTIKLVDYDKNTSEIVLSFCSTRKVEEHVKLEISSFNTEVQKDYFIGFKELFGTKSYRKQLFDFVVINLKKQYVEYRVDASNDLSVNDQLKSLQRIKSHFLSILHGSNIDENKIQAHNLFPKINALYNSNEGRVCELAFTVDTGATFHERMRNKDIDIRNEDFHSAGMEAVDKINTYKIAIEWKKEVGPESFEHKLELLLNSNMREIASTRPKLFSAHILKCFNATQYNELLSKIL